MIDKFGRNLTYLRVSLIDRCNLRCLYCMPHGPVNPFMPEELLSAEETLEIISIFVELGITKVRLTGGEPLLKKGILPLIEGVKQLPGIREVVMTTNGALLKHFARELKNAGLDRINVSLDTLDRENFRRITGLDKLNAVLEGIESAAAAGIRPIKVNAVLMKGFNDHEVLDLVRFAVRSSLHLRFIEWMPTAAEIHSVRDGRFLSADFARAKVESEYTLVRDDPDPHAPARTFRIEGTASTVGFISPLSNAFCAMCNRLRLKANGMLKTCLHGSEDLDVRGLLRSGTARAEIKRRIEETVFGRPKEHFLNDATVPHRDFVMTSVGG